MTRIQNVSTTMSLDVRPASISLPRTGFIAPAYVRLTRQVPSFPGGGTDLFLKRTPPGSLRRHWAMVPEARLCDTKPIKNTMPYRESRQLLQQLTPFIKADTPELSREKHQDALKRLLLVGIQLLDEKERLSRHPVPDIRGAVSIVPASLVLYRQRDGEPPLVLHTFPDMEPKPFTWPFREVANATQDWAKGKSPFSLAFGVNLLMQGLAGLNDILSQGPLSVLRNTAHLAENSILGSGQIAFSEPEFKRLQSSALRYGYSADISEFLPKVYTFTHQIAQEIQDWTGKRPDPSLKLGITYRDPKDGKKPAIQDVSNLFPGFDLNAFLPETERLRDYFEDLYYKS